ncbi:M81 family metallopeptidase [Kordiimonas pumila]|uniref:Microcystinase C n=1 Tax=Kordiimonas pumila TaxID=2161677 RepID=A0ABV7D5G2_9PROT|nr:M81 family metallopeptidase [Kordiimonas pumila]
MRVYVSGIQHETNTFLGTETLYGAFEVADAWPGLLQGTEVITGTRDINLPVAGFIAVAEAEGWDLVPGVWCSAGPSGPVAAAAYATITEETLSRLKAAGPVDAVYLDLHGAMVATGTPDADGDLLHRVRVLVGPEVFVVASLDMHANVSQKMVEATDALVVYRTYPHVDMAETGQRAGVRLKRLLLSGRQESNLKQLPFLLPMGTQSTLDSPMAEIIHQIEEIERWGGSVELATGFPLADVAECGPSIISYGPCAAASSKQLYQAMLQLEGRFRETLLTPDAALSACRQQLAANPKGPVLLIDTQDNPGCGGTGDTVGLLKALIEAAIPGTVVGVVADAQTCAQAHAAGVGASLDVSIGAQHGFGETPLQLQATVTALGDGFFTGTGPFYLGCRFSLGLTALLTYGTVQVVLASTRQQAADQAMFRHLGIEPADAKVLALKSSVHYRADFGAIASAIITVISPGANTADLTAITYKNISPNTRIAGRNKISKGV